MLAWMIYAVVVGLILTAAALVAERAAQMRKAPARWLWAAGLSASVLLPFAAPQLRLSMSPHALQAVTTKPTLHRVSRLALPREPWRQARAAPAAARADVEVIAAGAWAAGSGAILMALLVNGVLLARHKRGWGRQSVAGVTVHVSHDVGPAVVGLLRPSVVVPRWIVEAPVETQAMVIAHERSHLKARDAQLLGLAVLLVAAMPWNPALWWQLRRLRFAIETDCDARVLRGGCDLSRYAETLILVGERQSRAFAVAAMSQPKSFLEQRLRRMLAKETRFAWASATALAGLGFVLAASAAEISPPNAGPLTIPAPASVPQPAGARPTIAKPPTIPIAAQPAPPAPDPARPEVERPIVLAENTAAPVAEMPPAARTRAADVGQPHPGSEEAVRQWLLGLQTHQPDYSGMTPAVEQAARQQSPSWEQTFRVFGRLKSLTFTGASAEGDDVFEADLAHAKILVTVAPLTADGKLVRLTWKPIWSQDLRGDAVRTATPLATGVEPPTFRLGG